MAASYSLNSSGIEASHNSSILSIGSAAAYSPHASRYGVLIPGRVFICGIFQGTMEAELRAFFESYGQVKDVKIIRDYNGTSKGYGFVTFEFEEDSNLVLDAAKNNPENGLMFKAKKLSIGPAIKRQGANVKSAETIGMGNVLPSGATIFYGLNGVPYLFYNGVTYPPEVVPVAQTPYPYVVPQPTTIYIPAGPTHHHIAQPYMHQDHQAQINAGHMGTGGCNVAHGSQVVAPQSHGVPQYRAVSHGPGCTYQMPYTGEVVQQCGVQGGHIQQQNAVSNASPDQQQHQMTADVFHSSVDMEGRYWQQRSSAIASNNSGSTGQLVHVAQKCAGGAGSPRKQWPYATVAGAGSPTRCTAMPAPRMHSTPQILQPQRTNNTATGYQQNGAARYYGSNQQQHMSPLATTESGAVGSPPKVSVGQLSYKA